MKHLKVTLEIDMKFPEVGLTLNNGDIVDFDIKEIKKMGSDYLLEQILTPLMHHRVTLPELVEEPIAVMDEWCIIPEGYTYMENGEESEPDAEEGYIPCHYKLTTKLKEIK